MSKDNDGGVYSLFRVYEKEMSYPDDINGSEIISNFINDVKGKVKGFYRHEVDEDQRIFMISNQEKTQIRLHGFDSALIEVSYYNKYRISDGMKVIFDVSSMEEDNVNKVKEIIDTLYIKYALKYDKRNLEAIFYNEDMEEILMKIIDDIDGETEKRLSNELGEEYEKMKWKMISED